MKLKNEFDNVRCTSFEQFSPCYEEQYNKINIGFF